MEAALRQRGRGQIPWAEKVLMEEITKETPCLQIYREIKEILGELGLEPMCNGDGFRPWTRQQRRLGLLSERTKPVKQQGKFFSNIATHQARVSWGGVSIPAHVFERFRFWNKWSSMQQVVGLLVISQQKRTELRADHEPRSARQKTRKKRAFFGSQPSALEGRARHARAEGCEPKNVSFLRVFWRADRGS